QKNLGPAGLTIVIVRAELLGAAHPLCPSAFNYQKVAENNSMLNTPPTYAIYLAGLVCAWLLAHAEPGRTALEVIEERNIEKAAVLYAALDASPFYTTRVVAADR